MELNYLALEAFDDTLKRKALFKDIKIALDKKGKQPEHAYAMAQSIFKIERNKPAADSIRSIAIKLYPKGRLAVAALMEQIPLGGTIMPPRLSRIRTIAGMQYPPDSL